MYIVAKGDCSPEDFALQRIDQKGKPVFGKVSDAIEFEEYEDAYYAARYLVVRGNRCGDVYEVKTVKEYKLRW